jgi:hypothetical protein
VAAVTLGNPIVEVPARGCRKPRPPLAGLRQPRREHNSAFCDGLKGVLYDSAIDDATTGYVSLQRNTETMGWSCHGYEYLKR